MPRTRALIREVREDEPALAEELRVVIEVSVDSTA